MDSNILKRIETNSLQIDRSREVLFAFARELISIEDYRNSLEQFCISSDQLENLFSCSTALAFTVWQHLAAFERLQSQSEWQTRHQPSWQQISSGLKLCGLATTHLANPAGSSVRGVENSSGYSISGVAPWVCGSGLFEKLLVGFETESEIVFALVDFPSDSDVAIKRHELAVLNGTSTVSINFNEFQILNVDCVSKRKKDDLPASPRKSSYLLPEIGIAKGAIDKVSSLVAESEHPKHQLIRANLSQLTHHLESFKQNRKIGAPLPGLILERDKIIRDSIRLLGIAIGAASLSQNSLVSRLELEATFLDQLIQSPDTLALKISQICSGK